MRLKLQQLPQHLPQLLRAGLYEPRRVQAADVMRVLRWAIVGQVQQRCQPSAALRSSASKTLAYARPS